MKALLTIGICGGLLAGVVWLYKRWERSQQEQDKKAEEFENGWEDDNHTYY